MNRTPQETPSPCFVKLGAIRRETPPYLELPSPTDTALVMLHSLSDGDSSVLTGWLGGGRVPPLVKM